MTREREGERERERERKREIDEKVFFISDSQVSVHSVCNHDASRLRWTLHKKLFPEGLLWNVAFDKAYSE